VRSFIICPVHQVSLWWTYQEDKTDKACSSHEKCIQNFCSDDGKTRKNYHGNGRNLLLYLCVERAIKFTIVIIDKCQLPTTCKILSNFLLWTLTPYVDEITGDHQCGFQCNRPTTTTTFSTFIRYWEEEEEKKKRIVMGQYISYFYILRGPMTQSGEKYYTIFSMNLVHLWN